MSDHDHNRRNSDGYQDFTGGIEEMIINEPDAGKRAHLVVLNNMSKGLVANTILTKELSSTLETHLKEYSAAKNQRNGWMQAGALFIGVIQVLIGYLVVGVRDDSAKLLTKLEREIVIVESHGNRLTAIESRYQKVTPDQEKSK